MADREWLVDNTQVYESGEEEYFVNGAQINEDQAAAPPTGNPHWYYAMTSQGV